ncbi:MarR family transcriptional regulator [Streptomyces sp. NPDC007905]|uniref:MarR family winged helix-turn-helix transcriptional regulator n=1 Tax=Streptomyces sp. NPDC007905 TaxID=3364788 RepID=UPI0036E3FDDC
MASVFQGHTSTTAVARHPAIGPGAVSRLVDHLIAKGLIRREPDPVSRRTVLIVLTDRGRARVPLLAELADRNDACFFASLEATQREQLESWIRRLVNEHPFPPIPPTGRRGSWSPSLEPTATATGGPWRPRATAARRRPVRRPGPRLPGRHPVLAGSHRRRPQRRRRRVHDDLLSVADLQRPVLRRAARVGRHGTVHPKQSWKPRRDAGWEGFGAYQ